MKKTSHTIAVFDFDGTITNRDTFNAFLIYSFGRLHFYCFCFLKSYLFVAYFLGLISNQSVKEVMARHFLSGVSFVDFEKIAASFSYHRLPKMIKKTALSAIKSHRKLGDLIVVSSASLGEWIIPWSNSVGVNKVFSSALEVKNGYLTGKFLYNCYGENKKDAFLKYFGPKKEDVIHVYADSKGDRQLLSLATHQHYREL